MKKKNGFTLIELLAVIIILGILMIIAIPSVTKYISDSRKSAYVDTAKEIIGGARNIVNGGKLEMYSTNTTYYIPSSYIKTENASKSPYGDFTEAYIGVIYDGKGYKYYWISVDDAGQGVSKITSLDKLDTDDIESDLTANMIKNTIEHTGIGNRNKILILNPNNETWKEVVGGATNYVSEEGGESVSPVSYPEGKDKETVAIGEIVTIGTEEFYVVNYNQDNKKLTLLSHYNLNVGENKKSDEPEGIQSEHVIGTVSNKPSYGTMTFSNNNYWAGKVGIDYLGNYCTNEYGKNCAYVFDSNSNLYQYVQNYKTYLISQGAPNTIEVRLMKVEEASAFNSLKPREFRETSFWLGSAASDSNIYRVFSTTFIDGKYFLGGHGVRPVIVI